MARRVSDRPVGFVPVLGRRRAFPIYSLGGIPFLAIAVFGGPGDTRLTFGSLGLAAVSMFPIPERPAVTVRAGRAVLHFRPWRSPGFRGGFFFTIFGATMTWYGLTGDVPRWFVGFGLVSALVFGFMTLLAFSLISRRLTFGEHTLHVSDALRSSCDLAFPWEAITDVAPARERVEGGVSFTDVVLICPREAVIDRSSPNSRARQQDPNREWTLNPRVWTVEPGALAATIRFLVDHPDQRASITPRQVRAMLTPPMGSERARMTQTRRLDEYRASTERDGRTH